MDFEDYKAAMDEKLKEKFVDAAGVERDKYERCDERELKRQLEEIKRAVQMGEREGYIHPEDARPHILLY